MTENKKTVGEMCNDNRFELIEKAKQKLLKATNIETSQDEMKVLDSILFRVWQLGWLDNLEGPKTYEELKELVKNNIFEDDRNGVKIGERIKVEYILIAGKSFMPDGYILDEDNNVFAKNLTPAQMWAIIKSLIGEK